MIRSIGSPCIGLARSSLETCFGAGPTFFGHLLAYPFLEADKRIHTPTMFMGGTADFNVPLIGGEQMYQALKLLGVPTELVVYPGQFHGFTKPSYIKDRYERWLGWWDKYLKPAAASDKK